MTAGDILPEEEKKHTSNPKVILVSFFTCNKTQPIKETRIFSVTCLMTKEPLELETMKTKLRLPSPTSLMVILEKLYICYFYFSCHMYRKEENISPKKRNKMLLDRYTCTIYHTQQ